MTASSRVREHLRTNVIGYLALFCFAIVGTAEALPGKQSVESNDIQKNAVKGRHVKETKLNFGVVQRRIADECGFGEAIQVINQDGTVGCGDVGGATPVGPAGGDLTGTYPNPQIATDAVGANELQPNAVTSAAIAPNTVNGSDIDETQVDFSGEDGIDPTCNDDDGGGEDCATKTVTLDRQARVLLIGNATAEVEVLDDPGDTGGDDAGLVEGTCEFEVDNVEQNNEQGATLFHDAEEVGLSASMVTTALSGSSGSPTLHTFVWRCTEEDGDIDFLNTRISAVLLSTLDPS